MAKDKNKAFTDINDEPTFCGECGTAIPLGELYCNDDCRDRAMGKLFDYIKPALMVIGNAKKVL